MHYAVNMNRTRYDTHALEKPEMPIQNVIITSPLSTI